MEQAPRARRRRRRPPLQGRPLVAAQSPDRLNDQQNRTLRRLRAAGGEVWRAYTLKEALRAIFKP
ncbi:MAG: transposase, partial [Solirubrobacterales bacterium]|nr:transposase [Solirubrobacterales bacterium]